MEFHNNIDFGDVLDAELNLEFEDYIHHFVEKKDFYSEQGFNTYQVQTGLERSPGKSEVEEDLNALVDEEVLEREEFEGLPKMPDHVYRLNIREKGSELQKYDDTTSSETEGTSFDILRKGHRLDYYYDDILVGRKQFASSDVAETVMYGGVGLPEHL